MSGLSLFMGFFSAGTFVVWGSIAYSMGWVSITIQWTMAVAGLIVGMLIAPKWHKTGTLTAAEYIHKRLGKSTQKIYTYLFLSISVFLTASFLYPVAKILEVSTGLPLNTCILLLGGLCIFVCLRRRIMGCYLHRRTSVRHPDSGSYYRSSFIFRQNQWSDRLDRAGARHIL